MLHPLSLKLIADPNRLKHGYIFYAPSKTLSSSCFFEKKNFNRIESILKEKRCFIAIQILVPLKFYLMILIVLQWSLLPFHFDCLHLIRIKTQGHVSSHISRSTQYIACSFPNNQSLSLKLILQEEAFKFWSKLLSHVSCDRFCVFRIFLHLRFAQFSSVFGGWHVVE